MLMMCYWRHTLVLAAFAALAAAPSGGAQAPTTGAVGADRDCLRGLKGLDLQRATVLDLQAAMETGSITSAALVDAYLARIAAYDTGGPKLNAVRELNPAAKTQAQTLDAERRAGQVRGPLHGIPVLLKDNVGTFDQPTTAGSIALEGAIPRHDATITAKLRAAGAVILGKANLSEFANWVALGMPNGYSSLGGQVRNAHDLGDPLGSSAGSGVAASMALSAVTIGTETSGSIISPSYINGVVGVKPTLGLASRAGIIPLSPEFDVPGPIVRTTTDAAAVLQAIAGADPERDPATTGPPAPVDYLAGLKADALRGVRLAYSESSREGLSDEQLLLFDAGLDRLRKLGATVTAVRALDAEVVGVTELAAIPNDFKWSLNAFLADELPTAKAHTLTEIIEFNRQHPDKVKYGQNLLEASDATPGLAPLATAQAAPTRAGARAAIEGALTEGGAEAIVGLNSAHVNVGAAAGYPTVIVPLGYQDSGRTPVGLAFTGTAFSEPRLLAFAHAYERDSRARVAPTEVNRQLKQVSCGPQASAPFVVERLAVSARRKGRYLVISVRGAVAKEIEVVVRRGQRLVSDRRVKPRRGRAQLRVRVRRRGTYRVTVLDTGPPLRTVRAKPVRVKRVR